MENTKRDPFVALVFLTAELMAEQHAGNPRERELREAIDQCESFLKDEENSGAGAEPSTDLMAQGSAAPADESSRDAKVDASAGAPASEKETGAAPSGKPNP